ncbi:hypothetical protein G210_2971 [Candida maltosa Xu316]|uniref:ORC6 first cyclin-like domain-containing protein n=1 Tax=Candida maltosa (strain Xu316) TaxID=1245528 RepID=M3HHJ0_CANMX|nr:hypothetical protein G210_2971 [Candida maltosa Xu316]
MSSQQAKQALRDVSSNYSGEHAPKLLNYITSLYQLSLRKQSVLPNKSEIARFHLCAYVVVEKYQTSFDLPPPNMSSIPIQPKMATKLLDDFREFINQVSAASTPVSSPQKKKQSASPQTPTKVKSTATNGSPLKRLRAEMSEDEEAAKTTDIVADGDVKSPFNVPKRAKKTPSMTKDYWHDKKHVSIRDFIIFCNTFHIPSNITTKMVTTYLIHQHKFLKKSEWSLACGMIHAAYIRINHKLLSQQVGAKSEFMDLLLQYQKGGLSKWSLQSWCGIVADWIQDEPWIQEIEKHYMYESENVEQMKHTLERRAKIGEGWDLMEQFGAMIHGEHLTHSNRQKDYYDTWTKEALTKCIDE